MDGRAVSNLLNARDDELLARLQPALHDVVVADDETDNLALVATVPCGLVSATKTKNWPLIRWMATTGTVSPGLVTAQYRARTN